MDNNNMSLPADSEMYHERGIPHELTREEIKELNQRVLQINVEIKNINSQIAPQKEQITALNKEKRILTNQLRSEMSKNPLQGFTVRDEDLGMIGVATVSKTNQNINKTSIFVPEISEWAYTFFVEQGKGGEDLYNQFMSFVSDMTKEKTKDKYSFGMKIKNANEM